MSHEAGKLIRVSGKEEPLISKSNTRTFNNICVKETKENIYLGKVSSYPLVINTFEQTDRRAQISKLFVLQDCNIHKLFYSKLLS